MAVLIDEIVFDCTDPRRVAAFWAAALGYETMVDKGDWLVLHAADGNGPVVAFEYCAASTGSSAAVARARARSRRGP